MGFIGSVPCEILPSCLYDFVTFEFNDAARAKTYVKDMEAMKFTRYADTCCRILESSNEYETDAYLVRLVRMQQIAEKIGDALYSNDLCSLSTNTMSLASTIASLEEEVLHIEATLPLHLPQTCTS